MIIDHSLSIRELLDIKPYKLLAMYTDVLKSIHQVELGIITKLNSKHTREYRVYYFCSHFSYIMEFFLQVSFLFTEEAFKNFINGFT